MPVYEYNCKKCGTFTNLQSMLRAGEACACTKCGALSERALATPTLYSLSDEKRKAHSTNEKSAHEPNRIKGGNKNKDNGHGSNCSCCGSGNKNLLPCIYLTGVKHFPQRDPG